MAREMRFFRSSFLRFSLPFSTVCSLSRISVARLRIGSCVARSSEAIEDKAMSDDRMLVMVPLHPLIKHWISVLRNEQTSCAIFSE